MKKLYSILLTLFFIITFSLTNVNFSKAQESFFGVGLGWRGGSNTPGLNARLAFPVSHNLLFQPDGTFFFPDNGTFFELNGNLVFIFGNSNIQPYLFGGLNYSYRSNTFLGAQVNKRSTFDLNLGAGLALDMGTWAPFVDFKFLPINNNQQWMTTLGIRIYM